MGQLTPVEWLALGCVVIAVRCIFLCIARISKF